MRLSAIPPQFFAVATFAFVAVINACVKALGHDVPLSLTLCARFGIGFLILLPFIYKAGGLSETLRTAHPKKQCVRALLSMTNVALGFHAVTLMPLADATALFQTLGLFLLLLSGPILKEKIHPRHYLACALGFLGVLLIVHPKGDTALFPAFIMLTAAFLGATTTLTVRLVSRQDSELTIMTWFFGISGCLSLIWFLLFSPHPALSLTQIGLLFLCGLSGSLSQLCMTRAFKHLGADAMGPYTYSGILFSSVLGFLFFDETPTLWMLAGATCILLGIHYSHRVSKRLKELAPPAV